MKKVPCFFTKQTFPGKKAIYYNTLKMPVSENVQNWMMRQDDSYILYKITAKL